MLFLSSTIPVKKNKINPEEKIVRNSLLTIWGLLVIFGFISIFDPLWLQNLSFEGKKTEALTHKGYGDNYLKNKRYKAAVEQYRRALKIQPDLYSALGNLGITYSQMKMYDKAILTFKKLLKDNSKQASTNYFNLAEQYKKKGNFELAIKYYNISAESDPFPMYSYRYMGNLFLENKQLDNAIIAFRKALDNSLNMENSYFGSLKRDKELYSDKPEFIEIILSLSKKNDPDKEKRFDNSIFDEMLKKDKEIAKTHSFLGYSYSLKKDFPKAIYHYQKALEIWPKFEEVRKNLEKIRSFQNLKAEIN